MKQTAFESFAPRIIQSYKRNPNAFWEASLSPFLNRSPLVSFLKHSRLSLEMLSCFTDVHKQAISILSNKQINNGLNLWEWASLKSKEEYFTDGYPVYAFLVVWLYENKLDHIINKFDLILESVVYGIAGYGILDVLVDSNKMNSVELLEAHYLISMYENKILDVFGKDETNYTILHHIRSQFLEAEIKEKSLRYKASPYEWDKPILCGYKAAHLLTPFMLSLKMLDRTRLINSYFDVFFKFGAVIQIIDDYKDLEEDLEIGHYAYMCLTPNMLDLVKSNSDVKKMAQTIRENRLNNQLVYQQCKILIDESIATLNELGDDFLIKIVKITELRMNQYFTQSLLLDLT